MSNPKHFSTLRARAALMGASLVALRNDLERYTFILTRDALTLELPTLAEVEAWIAQAAGREAVDA